MLNNLTNLLVSDLRDLYSAESQLLDLHEELIAAVNSSELKAFMKQAQNANKDYIGELASACAIMSVDPLGRHCQGMQGLIHECRERIMEVAAIEVKDLSLISSFMRIIHYRISGLQCAISFAETLASDEVCSILQDYLENEKSFEANLHKVLNGSFFKKGLKQLAVKKVAG